MPDYELVLNVDIVRFSIVNGKPVLEAWADGGSRYYLFSEEAYQRTKEWVDELRDSVSQGE
jgi:hypothetical protein